MSIKLTSLVAYGLQGRPSSGSVAQLSPGSSSSCSQSPSSYTTQNPGSNSIISEFFEPYQSLSSPGSEVSSGIAIKNDGMDDLSRVYRTEQRECPPDLEVTHALRRLEEQLSLGEESIKGITPFYFQDENPNEPDILGCERENSKQEEYADSLHSPVYIDLGYGGHAQVQDNSNSLELLHDAGFFFVPSFWCLELFIVN